MLGFPGGSDGKESSCNAGDLASIPGLGRSPGEGNGTGKQGRGCAGPALRVQIAPPWSSLPLSLSPPLALLEHVRPAPASGLCLPPRIFFSWTSAWLGAHLQAFFSSITFAFSSRSSLTVLLCWWPPPFPAPTGKFAPSLRAERESVASVGGGGAGMYSQTMAAVCVCTWPACIARGVLDRLTVCGAWEPWQSEEPKG